MLTFDWQGLFRNYGDMFLPLLWPHLEQLASDPHESSQRCVCEITAGLIRGSKLWSFSQVPETHTHTQKQIYTLCGFLIRKVNINKKLSLLCVCVQVDRLWKVLCPLIRTALTNITVETYTDWGTCIATACVSCSHAYKHTQRNKNSAINKENWEFICLFYHIKKCRRSDLKKKKNQ